LFTLGPWEQEGCIPGPVEYFTTFIAYDAADMVMDGHTNVVAMVQQRLVPLKLVDVWATRAPLISLAICPYVHLLPFYFRIMGLMHRQKHNLSMSSFYLSLIAPFLRTGADFL
jgi:hypothetical protein